MKKGGGVALYIRDVYDCKLITTNAIAIGNVLECVTVDINFEKQKHASITCVYRAPGQNISTFCDNIVPIIDDGHRNGKKFVCGDFNINILQHEPEDSVRQFLDSMYALGLYPLITKPTRITRTTATIIDNIKLFTHDIELKN